jgi:hypothetical protein
VVGIDPCVEDRHAYALAPCPVGAPDRQRPRPGDAPAA